MNKSIFLLAGAALPAFCQTHPYSNAWSYVTSATTAALQISATTVAGTGGTATHTMSQIAIYIQSPQFRTASASDYPSGTTGQATAYLSLCGGGTCEDGNFFISSNGTTEHCGETSTTLYLDPATAYQSQPAWVSWNSITANVSHIARSGGPQGTATVTGNLQKSISCSGANISIGVAPNPSGIQTTFTPSSPQPASFGGGISAASVWNVSTSPANSIQGTLTVGLGIDSTPCTIPGGPLRSVVVTVI